MAIGTFPGMLQEGDHASRPAATAVGSGALYACSTHDLIYQSDGSSWSTWSDVSGASGGVLTTAGDILYRDGSGLQRLAIGAADEVLTVNAGATAPEWAAAAGGGGLTQAYVGYNTVGGSVEGMTGPRVYAKKVTLANACLITDIEAYIDQTAANDSVGEWKVGLYSDSAGTPDLLLAVNTTGTDHILLDKTNGAGGNTSPRWFGMPLGYWAAAGDYWIAVQAAANNGASIRYDATGSDRYYTSGGFWMTDWGFYAPTTTANAYSIRANTIR